MSQMQRLELAQESSLGVTSCLKNITLTVLSLSGTEKRCDGEEKKEGKIGFDL